MDFEKLVHEISQFKLEEKRNAGSDYFECVVDPEILPSAEKVISMYFGPAMKPAGKPPSKEAKQAAEAFGGIRKAQTLYCVQSSAKTHLAMLWPWQEGAFITIKLASIDQVELRRSVDPSLKEKIMRLFRKTP